jgi:hypothetical protein
MNDHIDSTPAAAESAACTLIRSGSDGRLCLAPQLRAELLDAFARSGMSAMAFARQHGVKYPTFMAWLAKRRREASDGGEARTEGPGFAEVLGIGGAAVPLRVLLPCGAVLEVAGRAALPWAAELLATLRRLPPC